MTRWCDRTACKTCPKRKTCPPEYKARKKAKTARATSVSTARIWRAAAALNGHWLTAYEVGCAVMQGSITKSGLRVLRRMEELGLVVRSPDVGLRTTYRLSSDGEEALKCAHP